MIVGITTRYVNSKYEERDCISHDWFEFFRKINVKLILIPNNLLDPISYVKDVGVERLLLTGGDSLGITNLNRKSNGNKTKRDITEEKLLNWSVKFKIPVLGVCRGIQMINVFFGGSITRNLDKKIKDENHRSCKHIVIIENGKKISVNSFHEDGLLENQINDNLQIFAKSPNGVVEGLKHKKKPIIGVQWHPERKWANKKFDSFLIKHWLNKK